jgi:hypothetical protein
LKKAGEIWKACSSHTYKKVKGGKYQSKTKGIATMLRGKATTLRGNRKVPQ